MYIILSRATRTEERRDRAIYCVFAARARPRSAAISCVAVIEYLKMSRRRRGESRDGKIARAGNKPRNNASNEDRERREKLTGVIAYEMKRNSIYLFI